MLRRLTHRQRAPLRVAIHFTFHCAHRSSSKNIACLLCRKSTLFPFVSHIFNTILRAYISLPKMCVSNMQMFEFKCVKVLHERHLPDRFFMHFYFYFYFLCRRWNAMNMKCEWDWSNGKWATTTTTTTLTRFVAWGVDLCSLVSNPVFRWNV